MSGSLVTAVLVLLSYAGLCSGLKLRSSWLRPQPSVDAECDLLSKVPHLPAQTQLAVNQSAGNHIALPSFSCHVAIRAGNVAGDARVADHSGATCSPVCAESLDVVVVLGVSDWSLEQADVTESWRSALSLLKHFELGRAQGSLFGFLDVSRGVRNIARVSPLKEDREALAASLEAWSPLLGGKAVTNADLQGFEKRPEVLAMLNVSRPSVRRTLLVLQAPQKASADAAVAKPSHLGLLRSAEDPFKRDREIMELLVSTCPAIRIDPSLTCGRMRWGSADNGNDGEMRPFGHASK